MQQALTTLAGFALCVALPIVWLFGSSRALDLVLPARGAGGGRNQRRAERIRPWLFLAPSLGFLGLYLVYPALATIWFSLHDASGRAFVGTANHAWFWQDAPARRAVLNSCLWVLVAPALTTAAGLGIAAMSQRVGWGGLARALIVLPTAISSVGAAVIWKFVYDYRPVGTTQTGILNAIVVWAGGTPQAWIIMPFWNSLALMAVLIWLHTGFAMIVLSAALRSIPAETVAAAELDGLSGRQIFLHVQVPQIQGAIRGVWAVLSLIALKVFDIVLAMTNGQWNTEVLASLMFGWMLRGGGDFGRGATVATVLMAMAIPVAAWRLLVLHRKSGPRGSGQRGSGQR